MLNQTGRIMALALAAGGVSSIASAQVVLYSNGPLQTSPSQACATAAGGLSSQIQSGGTLLGAGHQQAGGNRVADNFTVPAGGWTVSAFDFYAYQTGGSHLNPSTMTGYTVRLWDGPPGVGNIIHGDTTTLIVPTTAAWSTLFRHGGACATDRPIFKHRITLTSPQNLAPGQYWVDFAAAGTLASGPWVPKVEVNLNGGNLGANAVQFTVATNAWNPLTDGGNGFPYDLPFEVIGTGTAVGTGRCCLSTNGSCNIVTQAVCTAGGGTYAGDGTTCDNPNPCPPPVFGACCMSSGCIINTITECANFVGGVWLGGGSVCTSCTPTNLPPVVFSNCSIATGTTTLAGTNVSIFSAEPGAQWSEAARDATSTELANTIAGYGAAGANRLADDFVIPAPGLQVSHIRVYAYTTNATAPTATSATLRILDGSPLGTPNVVFGDQTTNRMTGNVFTPFYRIFNTVVGAAAACPPPAGAAPGVTRRIQAIDIAVNQFLPAGTYWVDFGYTGTSFTPPATSSTAIGRQCNPANSNGLQFAAGVWGPLQDDGSGCSGGLPVNNPAGTNTVPVSQDVFFEVLGAPPAACYANCDGSAGNPLLTANDFSCFLNKYVSGDSYADCDGVGGLTANDFTCFLGKYTAGCS